MSAFRMTLDDDDDGALPLLNKTTPAKPPNTIPALV